VGYRCYCLPNSDAAEGTAQMNWSFFQRIICLTNDPTEYALAQAEFDRVGLHADKYQAVKEIGPHQSFSHSERNILLDFLFSEDTRLLHLEDDVVFRDLDHLPQAISELPDDWDILYLGANLICWNNGEPAPERYSEHLFRVRAAWTTHAIAYHKRCIRKILEGQPSFDQQMWDNYLSMRLPELNAFVVAPMVAYQRPRYSTIWSRETDYNDVFEQSGERLR
jgi:hypothetical protein